MKISKRIINFYVIEISFLLHEIDLPQELK